MSNVNVGIVGLGFMGSTHLRSYLNIPGVTVAAVCDRRPFAADGSLEGVRGNLGEGQSLRLDPARVKRYTEVEDLMADREISVIDVCVPTPQHHSVCLVALRAGKHVLCEKPLARTSAICREIAAAAAASSGFFMPAMVMRFWPGWAWLKDVCDQRPYGRVLAARFRRACAPPGWSRDTYFDGAASGGALLDLHIHDTDFVQFCFGRPLSVFSVGALRFSGAIDYVSTAYQVAEGIPVTAEGSWLMTEGAGFVMQFTVNFERATVDFDLARGAGALQLCEEGGKLHSPPLPADDGYTAELRYFIQCVQSGSPPAVVTARDALQAVEICEAEEASIKSRQVVSLPQPN
jgi:predicted dehydrogenase